MAPSGDPSAAADKVPEVLFFDLETQRLFSEVGGFDHADRLGLAVGVVYSTRTGAFEDYVEAQAEELIARLLSADAIVGFNLLRFDYAVLAPYGGRRLALARTFDMLVELERILGHRVGLDSLARGTFGQGKSAGGEESVAWYKSGRLDLVTAYCRQDVALTRDLFIHGLRHGELAFVDKGRGLRRFAVPWGAHQDAALYLRAVG